MAEAAGGGVVFAAVAAVGEEQLQRPPTGFVGRRGVAAGCFDVLQDPPRLPRFGGVAERRQTQRQLARRTRLGEPGSALAKFGGGRSGADFFRGALATLRATYIGYHGDARDWYTENPELTVELLNRCGYWYFLHRVEVPEKLAPGSRHPLRLAWENRRVAPAYHPYLLQVRLVGPETVECEFDARNRRWLLEPENTVYTEEYTLAIPEKLNSGRYDLKMRLYSKEDHRPVFVALDPSLLETPSSP